MKLLVHIHADAAQVMHQQQQHIMEQGKTSSWAHLCLAEWLIPRFVGFISTKDYETKASLCYAC